VRELGKGNNAMSTIDKMSKIVQRVHDLTQSGNLCWEETEKEGVYQAAFPDNTVRIREIYTLNEYEEHTGIDYELSIYNEEGKLLEQVKDTDIASVYREAFATMKKTYESARRLALGVDTALDNLIGHLEQWPQKIEDT